MPNARSIKVVAVRGTCHAGLEVGDTFDLAGLELQPKGNGKACCVALATIVMNIGRLRLQDGPLYISCPDPATGTGGNVILELGAGDEA